MARTHFGFDVTEHKKAGKPGEFMDRDEQRRIVEALVLASPEPITAARLADLIPYVKPAKAKDLVNELNTLYQEQDRAFEIWEVASGYQIRTRAEFSGYLQKLQRARPMRLSRAALETLSIVSYKQPATRAEIEDVRGVECGPVLKSLLDRQLIRIAGHREVPGKPMVYGTTRRFLEVFGLGTLKDLPALRELDELAREQGLIPEDEAAADAADAAKAAEGAEAVKGETAQGETGVDLDAPEGEAVLDLDAAEDGAVEAIEAALDETTAEEPVIVEPGGVSDDRELAIDEAELGEATGPEPEIVVAGEPIAASEESDGGIAPKPQG